MKERREDREEITSDPVPTSQINSQLIIRNSQLPDNCEPPRTERSEEERRTANCELTWGGWNIGQPHTGQEIEGSFSLQKNDVEIAAAISSVNESSSSINTQITKSESVPTTAENLYETTGGWNIGQPHTGQEIESDFSTQKNDTAISTTSNRDEPLASTNTQTTETDNVPTTSQNLYEKEGGWNTTQSNTGQEIEGDLSSQKMETNLAQPGISKLDSSDEQQLSTTTQATETDNVPTTPQNLYETEVGWNSSLSQMEQKIEGDFRGEKFALTEEEIQACLKELRQVSTADDYWRIYEQSSQLVEEAWKLLNLPEQLRIQQICDEGVDPLEKWNEGDRCLLWHPFAQEKWGLATVNKVVRGACGFIYVLRDDGFGLHLGRDKLHLIAPTGVS
jgi:hypothetical protein